METRAEREKISSLEFIRRLNEATTGDGAALIPNVEVTGIITISDQNFKGKKIELYHCKIPRLAIIHITNISSIVLDSCEIGALTLINLNVKNGDGEVLDEGDILISKTIISGRLIIKDCKVENTLYIADKLETETIEISKSSFGALYVSHSEIKRDLSVRECVTVGEFRVTGVIINNRTVLTKLSSERLLLQKSKHLNSLEITKCKVKLDFNFTGIIVDGETNIAGLKNFDSSTKPSLIIADSIFKKNFELSPEESIDGFDRFQLMTSKFENGINITGKSTITETSRTVSTINDLHINCSKQLTGEININNLHIIVTNINGINSDASIIFNIIRFTKLNIVNFTNNGNLQFINTSPQRIPDSRLTIENSLLGKTQFASTNLADFSKFSIENSNLTNISTSITTWFSIEQLRGNEWPQKKWYQLLRWKIPNDSRGLYKHYCRQQKELFRQLKFAMEKQGNRIQSLVFKRYEMIAYKDELSLSKGRLGERFIMFFSRSNNYGQSWIKPLLFLLGFTLSFYPLLAISQSSLLGWRIASSKAEVVNTFHVFCETKKLLPQMLYPAHSLKDFFGENVNISGWTYTIDYTYKIILSYLIFQTISAFRKYVK